MRFLYFVGVLLSLSQFVAAQNRAFLNGDFETPIVDTSDDQPSKYYISANAPSSTAGQRIAEWNTTASDYNVELRTYIYDSNKGELSAVGKQHAEINASTVGRLYQNVCLIQGEIITYSFWHRGRKGYDEMEVCLYDAAGTTKLATLKTSGDDKVSWRQYSDMYNVTQPSGVYQFSFRTTSQSGGASEGNLLDDIHIGMKPIVSFSKANYSSTESGPTTGPYLKVNGTVPVGGLTITLSVNSLSAIEGEDYTAPTKTINVPAGEYNLTSDSFPLAFNVLNDNFKEYNEDVRFTILSVTNGATVSGGCGGSDIATYTIIDDDVFEAGPDRVVCPGDTITLTASGGLNPRWNKGVKQGVPFAAPDSAGDYVYTAYDSTNADYTNNLVVNGDFSAGNSGFYIDPRYAYNPGYDPSFGSYYLTTNQYSILANPRGTNPTFYNMTDHSGTNPSRMLIVDGYAWPDVAFWSQTIPVTPHTDYRFKAWFTSVGTGAPADIQIYANGTALGTHLALPEPGGWIPYTYSWNSGTSTSVVLRAVDINTSALDNDFAMDDVYFGPMAPFKDSLKVTVKPAPVPLVKDIDTCQQAKTHTLTATGSNLKWYNDTLKTSLALPSAPVIDLSIADTLSKWVTQTTNGCESKRTEIKISIRKTPLAPASTDIDSCQRVHLHTLTATGTNLTWYSDTTVAGSATAPIIDFSITDTSSRWVSQSLNGCESKKTEIKISIRKTPTAPNPVSADIDICQRSGTQTLTATGTNLKWYSDTTVAGSATAPIIDFSITDTSSRWVSQSLNGCESKKREIKISVRKTPAAPNPVSADIDICQRTGTQTLTATGTNLKWYGDTTLAGSATAPVIDFSVADTLSKWVSQSLNGCESKKREIKISVKKTPAAPNPVSADIDICQRQGTQTLTATGTNLKWYGDTTLAGSTTAPTIDFSVTDTLSKWVSQSLNGCESKKREIKISVRKTPAAPVSSNIDVCQQAGTQTLAATGTNLKWYSDTTVAGSTTPPIIDFSVTDTSSRWVSQSLNGCESKKTEIKISVRKTLLPPTSADIDVCQRAGTQTLAATGSNLKWYSDTTLAGSATAPVIDFSVADTLSIWVSQSLSSCESKKKEIKISVRKTPSVPSSLSADIDICQHAGTQTLTATGTNLKWYTDTTVAGSTTSPTIDFSVIDTSSRWVSQSLNGCESRKAEIKISVWKTPIAPSSKDIDTCQRVGTKILMATGSNLLWYADTTVAGSTTAPTINFNIPDTLSIWVSQSLNGCESKKTEVKIKIKTTFTEPSTVDLDTCQTTGSYTLKASGINLAWYDSFTSTTKISTAPVFDLSQPVSTSKWVNQSKDGCEGPRKEVKIQIRATPSAPVTRDTVLCQQAGNITLIATGNQLTWYDASVAGNVITPTFSTTTVGSTSYWVSQTQNGCESKRAKADLTVKTTPVAPTVTNASLCQIAGTQNFQATGTDLLWYQSGSTVGTGFTPSVNTNDPKTTTYTVTQTLNGCESPAAAVSIEVRQVPSAPLATDQVICESAGTIGYIVTGTNLKWYSSPTGVAFSTTVPVINRNNVGDHEVYASQTANNCESRRSIVKITVNPIPLAPIIPDVSYCHKAPAQPLTTRTDSLFWYTVAVGGTRSLITPTPSTQTVGITDYWVSTVEKGCESPRDQVTVTVRALPTITISGTPAGSYCSKTTQTLQGNGAVQYEWILPSGSHVVTPILPIPSFSTADAGKYVVIGTDANQCMAKDSLALSLKNPPSISVDPVTVCEKAPILIQAKTSGTAYWKLPGNRVQNTTRLYLPISAYSDDGRYVVVSTQNGCTDSSEVMITVRNCEPVTRNDEYSVFSDETLSVDASNHPILNDSDPNDKLLPEDFSIVSIPRYGQLLVDAKGNWTYKVNSEIEAVETIEYQICDRGQPSLCSKGKIEIEIKKRDVFFPDAFTPNGDGINDTYTVYRLSPQVKVDLTVFNRWGDLVYRNTDYKNDWKGTCSSGMCDGADLPVGTYFVVAELSNGTKHSSHLTLNR